jgi:NADPH:quinone reductase-like Zn-dependent oxidoreductase
LLNEVADLVDSGKVVTTVTRQLSPINLENIVKAHTIIEKREMIGKLVITH